MYRAQPKGNKILSKKWEEHMKKIHTDRLQSVRPSVDNKAPKRFTHLRQNLKRAQMEEERYSSIERHNRMLLGKMERIMRQKNTLDNQNEYEARSLNFVVRKREMMKITQENLSILKRIQHKEPSYDHAAWEQDAKRHESYLKHLCEYPVIVTPRTARGRPHTIDTARGEGGMATSRSEPPPSSRIGDVRTRAEAAIAAAQAAVQDDKELANSTTSGSVSSPVTTAPAATPAAPAQ
eukprot:TRINITY_DN3653_c0_g1_i1.p1 TRINITY_DN3653_c0_g1~~TRINITY_DN3653_c0_g1_i1.p1  ORF type:complete len:236 (-),score=41.32 TRINITY_DN3653_c0_g1_i1:204-911(-)